ncbi:MAG: proton-conducting transporter membrane subunit [Eubacteriales bacterium]|nr:proton-conducting transporter membrane subunit [Eubacteriales bacterium]MDD3199297.1 proton-conducting transporter membrane subunit [Eubacteriales bacterium]MDD4121296.1 proton-conducting transporter membrane subunit [Eubacteriales bacterium]MDD4629427.1 proton-conducting transporter membrane subunit [Eubacteriales bacterium]
MTIVLFLILFPLIAALTLLVFKTDAARDIIVKASSILIAAASIYLAVQYFDSKEEYFEFGNVTLSTLMMVIEICLAIIIFYLGIKNKKYLASVLAAIQTPVMVWFELNIGHSITVVNNLYADRFSIIMGLIIGVIGTSICWYSIGYMKDFQHHHHEEPDRRPWFFFLMFLFISAMFGIVFSNNLVWLYFFWEITTLCSFFLISYTKTQETINNAFRALIMNLFGGVGFVLAIVVLGRFYGILELNQMIAMGTMGINVVIPASLLAFAGITKAAQMPFNSWLLGAMVAPTPTSALLHSSTMVKAGVFIIVKLSPVLGWNIAGIMVTMVGGITFLLASFAAISQSNAKRVLAYSTAANLGLIAACAGIGTYAAVWAAIMLIIFHAVTKSLLFLCVGTAEHNIGSRDIEDMDGLFGRMPKLATFMIVGIAGMFLAPFGMLISKWAAMKAFIDSGNILLVMIIAFGSAATLFYWTKWLGKMAAIMAKRENIQSNVHKEEWHVLTLLTLLTIIICLIFPMISSLLIVPYLQTVFPSVSVMALSSGNMYIMSAMLALVVLLPLLFNGKSNRRIVPIYMSGANLGDDLTFRGSMQKDVAVSLKNWYMEEYFGEKKMNLIGIIAAAAVLVSTFALLLGGLI